MPYKKGEVVAVGTPYNIELASSRVKGNEPRSIVHIKIHKSLGVEFNTVRDSYYLGK